MCGEQHSLSRRLSKAIRGPKEAILDACKGDAIGSQWKQTNTDTGKGFEARPRKAFASTEMTDNATTVVPTPNPREGVGEGREGAGRAGAAYFGEDAVAFLQVGGQLQLQLVGGAPVPPLQLRHLPRRHLLMNTSLLLTAVLRQSGSKSTCV